MPDTEQAWRWKPSEIPEGQSVVAHCTKPACHGHRYLPRSYLIEKVGDVPLYVIERRLRCVERPWSNKRGPGCGAAMTLGWTVHGHVNRPSDWRSNGT